MTRSATGPADAIPPDVMARYLASRATPEDRALVEAWATASPANAADLDHLRTVYANNAAGIPASAGAPPPPRAPRGERLEMSGGDSRAGIWIGIGVLVAAIAAGGMWYMRRETAAQTYTTAMGEMKTVSLPDSTRVTLGPLTELRVSNHYGSPARRVDLRGEAWFEVRHDGAHPFQVYADGTLTEDLSTQFGVRSLVVDSVVSVVVGEGSVSVRLPDMKVSEGATLNEHDSVQLEPSTSKAHILRNLPIEWIAAWRTGSLVFNAAPLSQVAIELQRWYGITMRFESPELAQTPATYTIPSGDRAKALEAVGRSQLVHITQSGDTLVVRKS